MYVCMYVCILFGFVLCAKKSNFFLALLPLGLQGLRFSSFTHFCLPRFLRTLAAFSSNGVRVFSKGVQARRMIILKARRWSLYRSLCFKRVYGDVVLQVHGTENIFFTRFVRIAYERLNRRFVKLNSREK